MADIPFSGSGTRSRWRLGPRMSSVRIARGLVLLLAFLLALGWSGVLSLASEASQRRCDTPVAKLAVKYKLDTYYSGCRCMEHKLDFSDPCNSMYIPMVH